MNNNFNKKKYEIIINCDDNDDYFIHYQTKEDLKMFMTKYHNIFTFGHICCNGYGCLIKSENMKKIKSNQDIYRIKMDYKI